jgi:hypothetical protein
VGLRFRRGTWGAAEVGSKEGKGLRPARSKGMVKKYRDWAWYPMVDLMMMKRG